MTSVINLSRGVFANETGWSWSVERDGSTLEYQTNAHYEGLFCWNKTTQNWNQCKGTGQFSLSANKSAAMRQLNKIFF